MTSVMDECTKTCCWLAIMYINACMKINISFIQEIQASRDHAAVNFPTTLSLLMNSDGVELFKSSKVSMWPVLFMINELPFSERYTTDKIPFDLVLT